MPIIKKYVVIAISLLLSACAAVGPDYTKPETPVDDTFSTIIDSADTAVAISWWEQFNDPLLNELINEALTANHDLRIAIANLYQARAQRRLIDFDRFPTVTTFADYTNEQLSGTSVFQLTDRNRETYQLGFDASWEVDFFGRVRRNVEVAVAEVEAFEASRRDVIVSLTAELARNYIELRGAQQRIKVAHSNAENQQNTLELTQVRMELGVATELDVVRARAQVNTTLSTLPQLEIAEKLAVHRIAVLTGNQPAALLDRFDDNLNLPATPEIITLGTPEDLLRRRPDIRFAERTLAASTAFIGVATADLFPRITLLGSVGLQADTFSGLGDSGSDVYSFGPSITWAAFDLGRVRANISAADAASEAALAQYEKTVLTALEETENSLTEFRQQRLRFALLQQVVEDNISAADLANELYESGIEDFLSVLDADRNRLESEDQLVQSRISTLTALISVYKALGGGWEVTLSDVEKNPEK